MLRVERKRFKRGTELVYQGGGRYESIRKGDVVLANRPMNGGTRWWVSTSCWPTSRCHHSDQRPIPRARKEARAQALGCGRLTSASGGRGFGSGRARV